MLKTKDHAHTKDIVTSGMRHPENEPLFVGGPITDHDIDGLELSHAAQVLGISVDEIWRRVRNGLLIARTVRGKVLVYTDMREMLMEEGLPPPPTIASPEAKPPVDATVTAYHHQPVAMQASPSASSSSQELALLIDHLSLAKDENREILRLTQDSMARLTQMTDAILEMKDAVIATKEEQMSILKTRLSEQAAELTRILKEKEDLETLAQALQSK